MKCHALLFACNELESFPVDMRSLFVSCHLCPQYTGSSETLKAMIDSACQQVATDNIEVACTYIQKTAVEKVVPEMDKRIAEV